MAEETPDTTCSWKTRYSIGLLCLLGMAVSFATRVNISVAIVDMVNNTALAQLEASNNVSEVEDPDACPHDLALTANTAVRNRTRDGQFVWDKHQQGEILSGYYYGYTMGHIPGGLLADRFGGKTVMACGVFISSALSILTLLCARAGNLVLFFSRVLQGLVQGGIVPGIQTIICRWAPDNERSKFSVIFLGMFGGIVVSMAVTGAICETPDNWQTTFYLFGGLGVAWCIPWLIISADSPSQHPRISPAEKKYIEANIESSAQRNRPVPFRKMLTCPVIWAIIALMVTFDWNFYLFITSLPLFLDNILHFDMRNNGLLSAIPHIIGGAASLFFGWITDFVFKKGYISKINGFRIINALGTLGPALALIVVANSGCNVSLIVAMLSFSGFCMATNCAGPYMNMQVIAPNYAGTIVGIVNTFANMSGIAVPYVISAFTDGNQTRAAWNSVFYLSAGLATGGFCLYATFTSTEEQAWNNPPPDEESSPKNNAGGDNIAFEDITPYEIGQPTSSP